MPANDQPELLFLDTFSHDTSEELNLDLVQFPKSVFVKEIRIIPLGARVEGDFPGGVRLGATNPTKFHIDFFVNDLSKPGASTFEALGSLEYCQNGKIHMECGNKTEDSRIPTDGLVLKGCYTTITLAVYGNLTQVIVDPPLGSNPPNVRRQSIPCEIQSVPSSSSAPQSTEWSQEGSNPIPTYTSNVAVASNPDAYNANSYPPENYDTQVYRNDYYDSDAPKDPRTYHHVEENWDKERRDLSCERERHSPRSADHDRDRRDLRSRRRSLDRVRSRESSRLRDRSREIDRIERLHSRTRSRERDYRPLSRSRSRSIDRDRIRGPSTERDWDRGSYKKDDYRRHRDSSYDRSRGGSYDRRSGSYERRSPYSKRTPSYERERKISYEKRGPSYERRLSPYEKRGSSFERRAPSYDKQAPYDKKRHSPYRRVRGSSYGSRSPDDPRKRPRSPPGEHSRRPLSPREGETSPIHSLRSEEGDYDRNGKAIPRVEFYHSSYRHKTSIRSPSQEADVIPFVEPQHSSLVTVQIVDNATVTKTIESPPQNPDEEKSMDAEEFEPILSDEDICDDSEGQNYVEPDYDLNECSGADDIIKYYNPFKTEWTKYEYVNKTQLLANKNSDGTKNVLTAGFSDLCDASTDLFKIYEMSKIVNTKDTFISINTFTEVDNSIREDWVHYCEQLYISLTNLTKNTDLILRIFRSDCKGDPSDEFCDIYNMILTFCRIGLNFNYALAQQQPTYKIRHMKCGIRIAEALFSHRYSGQVMKTLLNAGIDIPILLLNVYSKEYMSLSIRLMILKALSVCLSSKEGVDHFMKERIFPKFGKDETEESKAPKNGYQALIFIMETNPLARIKFSISALIKKLNYYELLVQLKETTLNICELSEDKSDDEEPLPESTTDFIVNALEQILQMFRTQCFHMSQPKRFLPVSAQFEINRDCSNEGLLEYFEINRLLDVCIYLLTSPRTCNNMVITSPIYDLIHELVYSEIGLDFLYKNMEISELIFKSLTSDCSPQITEEFLYPHDLSVYTPLQVLGLEMAYRLRALYHLQSICDLQAGKADENELIDRLHLLYCLTFGNIGRTAVADVIATGDNAAGLIEVFEKDLRSKARAESPAKQKSPAKGYAIELIASAVRYSGHVPFLKRFGRRLLSAAQDHDRFEPSVSSVLQEVIPYLKPIEKLTLLNGDDMAECVEILRASLEHAPDLPGELATCLRILSHFCLPDRRPDGPDGPAGLDSPADDYVELKYKHNALQLFSLDGVAHLTDVLERLATQLELPGVHASYLASLKGIQLAQVLLPCLRLLGELLARVVKCRGARFRDTTAVPVLLRAFGLLRAFPPGAAGARTAARASAAAVRALLAFAQPIADDAADGDSVRRGPWTALCAEVVAYTMAAPCSFVPGLLAFSELLPLPLPMRTEARPSARELEDASNERRLWSAHLHALAPDLANMIRVICTSSSRAAVRLLRRVCVQVADLAPNTAASVARAAVGALLAELRDGEPASAAAARALAFLERLLAHAPVKSAALLALGAKGPGLLQALAAVLRLPRESREHAAAQELAAHCLAALCDAEVTLTPLAPPAAAVANALPSREALQTLLDATALCLEAQTRASSAAAAVLRAYFVLTEHEFGFQQFRRFVGRRRESLGRFFAWAAGGGGGADADEGRTACLGLFLGLVRALRLQEGEGPLGRSSRLSLAEMADMVAYIEGEDHPAATLDKVLKERNFGEEVISNASFLWANLQNFKAPEEPGSPSAEVAEAAAVAPESLVAQFAARRARVSWAEEGGRAPRALPPGDPLAELPDAKPEAVELQAWCALVAGGAAGLALALRRLSGLSERLERSAPPAAVGLTVSRCEAADAFRSRPPNTSRPPSLHVDDFTALHHQHYPPRGGMRRGSERGRFPAPLGASAHAPYRQLRGRGAWDMGAQHFAHFAPTSQYMMGGMGWGGGRMNRGPRHRSFPR